MTPDPRELLRRTTPGPWVVIDRDLITDRDGLAVASTEFSDQDGGCPPFDARLIAAAPDLARRLAEAETKLDSLVESLFHPEMVGNIEVRASFSYKSSKPPTFNLYRGEVMVAQGIVSKKRALTYARAEALLAEKPKEGEP